MENKKPEEKKMEIEISKYKNLVDALGDPVRVARMVLLIAAVAAILAVGIIGVVCGIKRFYPYKSINSNPYGATIIQDEDNEIIYWLFNTADLWANSGIEVEEGDIISVRTSGAFHTAIHHLVQDANDNTKLRDPWSHSEGKGPLPDSPLYERSKARAKYRIAPDLSRNTILMQVIPPEVGGDNVDSDWRTNTKNACYVDGQDYTSYKVTDHCKSGLKTEKVKPDIYKIGLGKENIRIRTEGVLHFAVNDIALTSRVIDSMNTLKKNNPDRFKALDLKPIKGVWYAKTTKEFNSLFTESGLLLIKTTRKKGDTAIIDTVCSEELNIQHLQHIGLIDNQGKPVPKHWEVESSLFKQIVNNKGCLIDSVWENERTLKELKLFETTWPKTEIDYYKETGFIDAWFVDNIGSFMIVIERKKVR